MGDHHRHFFPRVLLLLSTLFSLLDAGGTRHLSIVTHLNINSVAGFPRALPNKKKHHQRTRLLLGEPLDRPPAASKLRRDLLQRHRALGQVSRLLLELVAQGDELARREGADVEAALVKGR